MTHGHIEAMSVTIFLVIVAMIWEAQCAVTGLLNSDGNNFKVSDMTEQEVLSIAYNLRNAPPDNNWNMMRGYHLFLGNPNTPNTQVDPGFLRAIWSAGITSKGFNFFPTSTCSLDFSSTTISSTDEYQSDLETTASVSGGYKGFLATASAGFKRAQERFESENSVVVKSEAMCSVTQEFLAMSDPPELSSMFEASIRATNFSDSYSIMTNLFDQYGTHYPTEMLTGSRFVIESKLTHNAYRDMISQGIDVNVAASYSGLFSIGGSAGIEIDVEYTKSTAKTFDKSRESKKILSYGARPKGDGRSLSWAAEADFSPLPIRYKLDSLDNMFTPAVMGPYGFTIENITAMRESVRHALDMYCEGRKEQWEIVMCQPYTASKEDSITSKHAVEEAIQLYKITQVKPTYAQTGKGDTSFFTISSPSESNPFFMLSDTYSNNPYTSTIYAVSSDQMFALIAPSGFNEVTHGFSELTCAGGYSPVGVVANPQDNLLQFYTCVNDNYLMGGIAGSVISNGNLSTTSPSIKKRSQPVVDMNIPYVSTSNFYYIQEKYLKRQILNIDSYSVAQPRSVDQIQVVGMDSNKRDDMHYLIDGDDSCSDENKCYTQTGGYIVIDLGNVYKISRIVAVQPCEDGIDDYQGQLFYGTIDAEFTSDHNLLGGWGFKQRAPNAKYEVEGNNNRARYIVQRAPTEKQNALCEITVFGIPDTLVSVQGRRFSTETQYVCKTSSRAKGVSASTEYVGKAEGMSWCVNLVKQADRWANGATMLKNVPDVVINYIDPGPWLCYKEVRQTSASASAHYINCIIEEKTWEFSAVSPRVPWQATKKLNIERNESSEFEVTFERSEVTMVRILNAEKRGYEADRLKNAGLEICDDGNCRRFARIIYAEPLWLDYACPSVVGDTFRIISDSGDEIDVKNVEVFGAPVNPLAPKYIMPTSATGSPGEKSKPPGDVYQHGLMSDLTLSIDSYVAQTGDNLFLDVNFEKADIIFIELVGRTDCCDDRMQGMKFEICDKMECSTCSSITEKPHENTWIRKMCPIPLTGDRLHIFNPNNKYLEIGEIRIAGWKL